MSYRKVVWGLVVAGLMTAFAAGAALAQVPGAADPGQTPRGPRGGGNFDPAALQKQQDDQMKSTLGVTDDEWKALQPRIAKVQALSRAMRAGMMGGRGGRGGRGGNPPNPAVPDTAGDPTATALQQATNELRTLLDNKDADPKDIAAKVTVLRAAREKAKTELTKAQTDLRGLLTPRQEAALILQGLLD